MVHHCRNSQEGPLLCDPPLDSDDYYDEIRTIDEEGMLVETTVYIARLEGDASNAP